MKFRTGFVSNSSSASFIVDASELSDFEIFLIEHHGECSRFFHALDKNFPRCDPGEEWWIHDHGDGSLSGGTDMTNYNLKAYCARIGVDPTLIEWT